MSFVSKAENIVKKKGLVEFYGAWQDDHEAEEIVQDIYNSRILNCGISLAGNAEGYLKQIALLSLIIKERCRLNEHYCSIRSCFLIMLTKLQSASLTDF